MMKTKDSRFHPENYIAEHVKNVPRSGIRDFFEIVSTRDDVISLSIGEPDFVTPWHIREAAIYALDHGVTSYTANLGLLKLRQEIASYVNRSYHADYNPRSEILVTVGVSEALDLAIRAITAPGDEIIYHEPCYVSYAPVITFTHGVPVKIETDADNGFRLNRAMVEPLITPRTKALLLNFPTNPTGGVLTSEDINGLADLALERDILIIADEIYSELTYDVDRSSMLSRPDVRDHVIFLNGCSKAWAMTGFRVGFACAVAPLIEAMMKIHQYSMLCAPVLSQEAAIEALRDGDKNIAEMRREYRQRRNFIHKSLNEIGLNCHLPQGAFYVFPKIGHLGLSSRDFALQLLEEEQVACVPGTAFGPGGEGFLRCSYATAFDDIKEAMRRMRRFVGKLT